MQFESLSGKIAIVTGASKGIGKAIARLFAEKGAIVYALARGIQEDPMYQNIIPIPCDITKENQVSSTIEKIVKENGTIDILINNAGVGHFAPIHQLEENQWDEMINVNLKGAFLCAKYVVPHLLTKKSGHIINISSVAGIEGFPTGTGYCASKFGLMGLTDSLLKELKPHGIKVSAICPGSVQTYFGGSEPKDYALLPEDVAWMAYQMVAAPQRVIMNQVVMRPKVK
jgi:NAD(P)-dependent dehydrogenase (short-subunit alcohol dehydrogenase family)